MAPRAAADPRHRIIRTRRAISRITSGHRSRRITRRVNIIKQGLFPAPVNRLHRRHILNRILLLRQHHPRVAQMVLFEEIILPAVSGTPSRIIVQCPASPAFLMTDKLQGVYSSVRSRRRPLPLILEPARYKVVVATPPEVWAFPFGSGYPLQVLAELRRVCFDTTLLVRILR